MNTKTLRVFVIATKTGKTNRKSPGRRLNTWHTRGGTTFQTNSAMMKRSGFILVAALCMSCATTEKSGLVPEDEMFVTRKYVGNFVEFRHTSPTEFGGPHIVWIKTTQDSIYGKISAYSRKCEFQPGDRLYIRRTYNSPGLFGFWIYQIENDSEEKVWYEISEFQYGNKVLAQSWF